MTQMRSYLAWALTIVGVLAAQACTDSDPVGPDGDILVVRAFLFAGEPVADIRITTTVPLVSEDTLGIPVSDATVWLERDDVRFDLIATPGAAGAYHYPGPDLVIGSGEIFELGIFRGSESISATTVVPPPPEGFTVSSDVMDVVDLTAGGFGGRRGGGGLAFGGLIVRWINPERDLFFVVVDNLETDPVQISAPEFIGTLSANVRETRSTQRIRVGRRQRKRTCWDCEREWKRMVVPLEPGRPSEARQLLRTQR